MVYIEISLNQLSILLEESVDELTRYEVYEDLPIDEDYMLICQNFLKLYNLFPNLFEKYSETYNKLIGRLKGALEEYENMAKEIKIFMADHNL